VVDGQVRLAFCAPVGSRAAHSKRTGVEENEYERIEQDKGFRVYLESATRPSHLTEGTLATFLSLRCNSCSKCAFIHVKTRCVRRPRLFLALLLFIGPHHSKQCLEIRSCIEVVGLLRPEGISSTNEELVKNFG
jgi:hypothetical protein